MERRLSPAEPLAKRLQEVARTLEQHFLDKQEIIRLLLISAIAGEHTILVGPPGTAKSAIIRMFARLIDARYFEYLLTRFTEPNELFGPVDIAAFRAGTYKRRTEGMLPESEIVFLDEVFKSNSAILNSLLTILNERRFSSGADVVRVPLISLFGATNDVPNDDALAAIFDRFLLRVRSDNLDSYHFHTLIETGVRNELDKITGRDDGVAPTVTAADLRQLHQSYEQYLRLDDDFVAKYKGLIFQIRSEGISVSDRRVIKLTKLFAAAALLDGRAQPNDSDFFVLKHIWNNLDQADLLDEIINPVVESWYREHPGTRRVAAGDAGLDALLGELKMIRDRLTSGEPMSDIQLFSQLKNLGEIKTALAAVGGETAERMVKQIDGLLESVFQSSRFG
ncbi:MAG TPA: AAA family ATPase [Polyangia bacterium]|nr:AAA family ATPase [Polyangia bacterium]